MVTPSLQFFTDRLMPLVNQLGLIFVTHRIDRCFAKSQIRQPTKAYRLWPRADQIVIMGIQDRERGQPGFHRRAMRTGNFVNSVKQNDRSPLLKNIHDPLVEGGADLANNLFRKLLGLGKRSFGEFPQPNQKRNPQRPVFFQNLPMESMRVSSLFGRGNPWLFQDVKPSSRLRNHPAISGLNRDPAKQGTFPTSCLAPDQQPTRNGGKLFQDPLDRE